jgi:hypothetical protein
VLRRGMMCLAVSCCAVLQRGKARRARDERRQHLAQGGLGRAAGMGTAFAQGLNGRRDFARIGAQGPRTTRARSHDRLQHGRRGCSRCDARAA